MPQPYLHDLVGATRAPALTLSGADGQVRDEGVHGYYLGERRILSRAVLTLDGAEPTSLRGHPVGGDRASFVSTVPTLGDGYADPTVIVRRDRHVTADGFEDRIEIASYARAPVSTTLGLELASDLAGMGDLRTGTRVPARPATASGTGLSWRAGDGTAVAVRADVEPDEVVTDPPALRWQVNLPPREAFTVRVMTSANADPAAVVAPATTASFAAPQVTSGDPRLAVLVARSVADLDALLLADPSEPADTFLGAGVPWYLTLFGRDSIWAARMLLPLGTDLAAGTLRTLARRQGTREDAGSGEQPGKIPHEIRAAAVELGPQSRASRPVTVPPVYYGTVDATALWISLLHDAWQWGLPDAAVAELVPALEAALCWLSAALDGDGFVTYRDASGHGLANQGWKDSADAVQFRDGTLAEPPIALCEVQGYAHAASHHGAALLDAFGRPGAARWRERAGALAERFRASFWVDGDPGDPGAPGSYPGIAIDGTGRLVDTAASNMGHLLGTGLLDAAEEQRVAERLSGRDLDCGYGLRTLAATSAGFNPLSYHCGSVWPHDTAIAIAGLAGVQSPSATSLVRGLLGASTAFDYRLPELYGVAGAEPLPYPAACRPQAWSAAASIVVLSSILGLDPDVPGGTLRFAPLRPSPVGELTVRGLRVAGDPLDVHLAADGRLDVVRAPAGLRVEVAA